MDMKVIPSQMDTEEMRRWYERIAKETMREKVHGPDGGTFLRDYCGNAMTIAREIGEGFTRLLVDTPDELELIAGRLKYLSADLLILQACAKAAGITDGRCLDIGLECAASVEANVKLLGYTLSNSQSLDEAV